MAIPQNYNDLIAEIANWLNRDDLNDDIPSFIQYAEERINRVSNLSAQEVEASVAMVVGQEYSDFPAGLTEIISLDFDDQNYLSLEKVAIKVLDDGKNLSISGRPQFYAVSDSNFYWNILPDQAYALTARYWKKWDIQNDNTNWLLTNNPSAYIYAALAHAGSFIDHPKQQQWEVKANQILEEIQHQSTKLRKATLRVDAGLMRRRNYNIYRGYYQ